MKKLTSVDMLSNLHRSNKVVFIFGTFDIPSIINPLYWESLKKHGDILVVGVYSDGFLKEKKDESYPFNERVEFLSGFGSIGYIIELETYESLYEAITRLIPSVLLVSSDAVKILSQIQNITIDFGEGGVNIKVLGPKFFELN